MEFQEGPIAIKRVAYWYCYLFYHFVLHIRFKCEVY